MNALRKFGFRTKVLDPITKNSNASLLPARAGVCFRVVVFSAWRGSWCRRRCRLLLKPDLCATLGCRLRHRSLTGGLHTCSRPGATKRRRGNPGQRRAGASALRLAEGPRAGVPRCSSRCSSRTVPIPRSISKLSGAAAPGTQIRPSAAAGHQTAVAARAGAHAVWICAATAADWGSVPAAAARSPPREVVSQRRRVRRRDSGVTKPPPSDPEDLLHIELLPRRRPRAATRHSRARHDEMAGRARAALPYTLRRTVRDSPDNRMYVNRDWRLCEECPGV